MAPPSKKAVGSGSKPKKPADGSKPKPKPKSKGGRVSMPSEYFGVDSGKYSAQPQKPYGFMAGGATTNFVDKVAGVYDMLTKK